MKFTNAIAVTLGGLITISHGAPAVASVDSPPSHSDLFPSLSFYGTNSELAGSQLAVDNGDADDDDDNDDEPEPPKPEGVPASAHRLKKGVWLASGNYLWNETARQWVPDSAAPKRLGKRTNDCASESTNDSNELSDGSPLASDCKALAESMLGHPRTWWLWGSTQRTLKKKGTCAFGATNLWKGRYAKVGNDDLQQNVESALAKHTGKNSKGDAIVAASGTMNCQIDLSSDWAQMTWGVYHSKAGSSGSFARNDDAPRPAELSARNNIGHAAANECPGEPSDPIRPKVMPEYAQYKCNGVWYVPGPLPKEPNSTLSSEARDCVDWSISSKDENSDASPLKSDCEVMYNNIAGEGSWYLPWSYVQRTFITYGTCAFGGTDITPGTEAWVGNDDIRKVLEWAFDSHTGKNSNGDEIVSGSGDMQCQPWGGRVTWGLYHSKNHKRRDEPDLISERDALTNDCENELVDPVDELSDGSPLVDDCYKLADSVAGKNTWHAYGHQQKTLKVSGTCAFGVENVGSDLLTAAKIGNDDIRKVIWAGINAHSKKINGVNRVAAKGTMQCQKEGEVIQRTWFSVNWGIYHVKNLELAQGGQNDVNGTVESLPQNTTSLDLPKTKRASEKAGIDDCRDQVVDPADELSNGSPTVEDCKKLIDDVYGPNSWQAKSGIQFTVQTHGTCAFGVTAHPQSSDPDISAKVGNEDLRQAVRAAIDAHSKIVNGVNKVAAKGTMKCQEWWGKDDSFSIPVDWAVYHSKNTEKKRSEEAELGQADDCRSTYVHDVDQVSAGSPLVEDCEELIKDAAKGHTWVVSDVQKTLKTHGTCAIGAQLDEKEGWDAKVGNVDIQQTLRLAIDRHTKVIDGVKRVAAMGHMKCQGTATRSEAFTKEVNWAVYHSK